MLMEYGPKLLYPYSSDVRSSRHGIMRELRAQSGGSPCPYGLSTPSTPDERPYCLSAETRAATTGSTKSTFRSPMTSTTNIWRNCERRS